jgi:hypothetical protein
MSRLIDNNNGEYLTKPGNGSFEPITTSDNNEFLFSFIKEGEKYRITVTNTAMANEISYINYNCTDDRTGPYLCGSSFYLAPPDNSLFTIVIGNDKLISLYDKDNVNYAYYDSQYKIYRMGKSSEPSKFKIENDNVYNNLTKNCDADSVYNNTSGECVKCDSGYITNSDKTQCVKAKYSCFKDCIPSEEGDINTKEECIQRCGGVVCSGNNIYSANRTGCIGCDSKVANADHTECIDEAKYDCTTKCMAQLDGQYTDRTKCINECPICEEQANNTIYNETKTACIKCPNDKYANADGTECLPYKYDCKAGCQPMANGEYTSQVECMLKCNPKNATKNILIIAGAVVGGLLLLYGVYILVKYLTKIMIAKSIKNSVKNTKNSLKN